MSLVSVQLLGLQALQQQLLDLGAAAGIKALAQAARVAFKPVLEAAMANCPQHSGALRASLRLAVVKKGGDDLAVAVGIVIVGGFPGLNELPPARRWHWIELGTARVAGHAFLRPALDANAQRVLDQLKVEIQRSIDKVLSRRS